MFPVIKVSLEGVLGTRFPGRRVLVAKYVQPRGPRHGEFPAAFTVGLPAEALAQAGHRLPATGH